MIILGIILAVLGYIFGISVLTTIGVVLVVIGAVFWILGSVGRPVGGRRVSGAVRYGNYRPGMANRFEYKVAELREGMLGGKMSGDKLEKMMNEHGQQGWQLKSIVVADIKGRIGPGGVEGLLITFERHT